MDTLSDKVSRGASYLDEVKPNWYNEVNLTNLNMANCSQCVIGHLFGYYFVWLLGSDFSRSFAYNKGFNLSKYERKPTKYRKLEELWKNEIKARRFMETYNGNSHSI